MKNTVYLVVAGSLLSAICLHIPSLASDEGQDTQTAAVATVSDTSSIDQSNLHMLEHVIQALEANTWLHVVKMEMQLTLNNTFKDTIIHQPGGRYVKYDKTRVDAVFKRWDKRQFAHEEHVHDNRLWSNYEVFDLEKAVSYDSGTEVEVHSEFSPRQYFQRFFQLSDIRSNQEVGDFLEGLRKYKEFVVEGAYELTMSVEGDLWIARFSLPGHDENYARIVFDAKRNFNVVEYEYYMSSFRIGLQRITLTYEKNAKGEWYPVSAERYGDNTNMETRFSMKVTSASVGPEAGLTEADFDWRRLPIKDNVSIRDYRHFVRLAGEQALELDVAEWVYGARTSLEALRGTAIVLVFSDSAHKASADAIETLNTLATRHSDVAVIAVHRAGADLDDLKKFISDKPVKFRVALDKPSQWYKGATFEKYGVKEPPAVYVFDTEGKVRYQDIPLEAVGQAVKSLLDE
jgi:hypothetical protein